MGVYLGGCWGGVCGLSPRGEKVKHRGLPGQQPLVSAAAAAGVAAAAVGSGGAPTGGRRAAARLMQAGASGDWTSAETPLPKPGGVGVGKNSFNFRIKFEEPKKQNRVMNKTL